MIVIKKVPSIIIKAAISSYYTHTNIINDYCNNATGLVDFLILSMRANLAGWDQTLISFCKVQLNVALRNLKTLYNCEC